MLFYPRHLGFDGQRNQSGRDIARFGRLPEHDSNERVLVVENGQNLVQTQGVFHSIAKGTRKCWFFVYFVCDDHKYD